MKKSIILLICMNMFSAMGYSIVAPLFPVLGKDFSISEALLGCIISTFAIANCITTPFVPKLCKRFSRIRLLYFATFFEATCTLSYSFLENIPSLSLFLIIVFSLRIIHGIFASFIITLVYSLACSLSDEDEIKSNLGYIEIGMSLGSSAGPLFVSIFYKIGGYKLPFLILGLFLYISVYLTKILENEKIDKNEIEEDPSFFRFLNNHNIILISGALVLSMVSYTFYFPCLTNHLYEKYNLGVSWSSLFFSVPLISYLIVVNFINIISKKLGSFHSLSFGILVNVAFIIIGLSLTGAGSLVWIFSLLELSKIIKTLSGNYDQNTVNDIASAINNLFTGIGDLFGPIIGGAISTHFSFKISNFFIFIIFSIFYILFLFFYNKDNKYVSYKLSNNNNITLQEELSK